MGKRANTTYGAALRLGGRPNKYLGAARSTGGPESVDCVDSVDSGGVDSGGVACIGVVW
jgi:hypothetical protein